MGFVGLIWSRFSTYIIVALVAMVAMAGISTYLYIGVLNSTIETLTTAKVALEGNLTTAKNNNAALTTGIEARNKEISELNTQIVTNRANFNKWKQSTDKNKYPVLVQNVDATRDANGNNTCDTILQQIKLLSGKTDTDF